jgi:hypothetical protein
MAASAAGAAATARSSVPYQIALYQRLAQILDPNEAPPEARPYARAVFVAVSRLIDGAMAKAKSDYLRQKKETREAQEVRSRTAKAARARRKKNRTLGPPQQAFRWKA